MNQRRADHEVPHRRAGRAVGPAATSASDRLDTDTARLLPRGYFDGDAAEPDVVRPGGGSDAEPPAARTGRGAAPVRANPPAIVRRLPPADPPRDRPYPDAPPVSGQRETTPATGYGPGDRILVVGAGAAGLAAAGELRRLGFAGRLLVLGGEPDRPYDRPACSKGLLSGHQKPSDTRLPIPDVALRTGQRAARLDLSARLVGTEDGATYAFDGLVIATGDRSALTADWACRAPNRLPLHGIRDALAVRRALRTADRVAIVGGGLTGCETACAVRQLARDAVIVDAAPYLMHRAIGDPMGRMVTRIHRRAGIETRLGRRVTGADARRGRWRLSLDDGSAVYADLVVLTGGERPDVAWLDGSGLAVSDGVLCDETLRALDLDGRPVPGVVAAGAAARWPNPWQAGVPTRCGQWIAALEQGREAARTLLAADTTTAPVAVLPRFWSQQGELRIEVCGRLEPAAEVSITELHPNRRHRARSGVLTGYYQGGRMVGVVAVNAPHAFTAAARALLANPPAVEAAPAAPAAQRFVPVPTGSWSAPRLAAVSR